MTIGTWLIDIPEEDCERLLEISRLGRIAVLIDGRPEIFPVNHVFDDIRRCVAFPTNDKTKLHAAVNWPFIAFEIDGMETDPPAGWSVLVVGHAEEIRDDDDIQRLSAKRTAVWRASETMHWVKIVPEKITGRRIYGPSGPE
jgi:nitroimidazol reductase NimA-like FMN-containing flavoprotein (pyridoxamine 5'-phosphate oxidase superfamily)